MRLKAVLLDLDGTLTNFNIDYFAARKAALQRIAAYGVSDQDLTTHLSVYAMLKRTRTHLSEESHQKLRDEVYDLLREVEEKAAEAVTVIPLAKPTLEALKRMSLRVGVVTNNNRYATHRILERYSLLKEFDAIVTRDDCDELKPDPGTLLKALDMLSVGSDEAAYVGDAVIDIQAAQRAGVFMISVPSGPVPAGELIRAGPDFLISDLSELPRLLQTEFVS